MFGQKCSFPLENEVLANRRSGPPGSLARTEVSAEEIQSIYGRVYTVNSLFHTPAQVATATAADPYAQSAHIRRGVEKRRRVLDQRLFQHVFLQLIRPFARKMHVELPHEELADTSLCTDCVSNVFARR